MAAERGGIFLKTLRIVFTALSAIFIALVIPAGALHSWLAAILCVAGAVLFFGLMLLCKQRQEENDRRARHDDLSALDFGGEKQDDADEKKE